MTASILSLLVVLIPFGIWLYKRHAAKKDDPAQQHREKYEEIEQPVVAPNTDVADELDELRRLQTSAASRERGAGGGANES